MNHRSRLSSLTTAAASNLVGLAQQRAQDHPDRRAYIFLAGIELCQSSLTYSELDFQARLIAGFLRGLKARGERALLLYPPGLEFIVAFFGCLYAGVIAVPAYPPRLNRNALRIVSIAQDSQASLILTTNAVFSRLGALTAHAPELGKVRWFATDNLGGLGEGRQDFFPDRQGLAYLQYTSGSTATPKGVMITHANVLDNSAYLAKAFRHSAEDISLSWLPHFHDLGLVHGILQPLYSGFPGYLMAPMSFLQRPLDWLQAISRFRVTHSDGPNFAYELCVDKITSEDKKELDLSSWRMALNGAEPVFPETIERFTTAFAECGFKRTAFYPAYGLAEATLVVSGGKKDLDLTYCSVVSSALEQNKLVFADEGTPGARTLVASGCFAPPMKVEIVDPGSGKKCALDTIGEIWVAGPSLALGYWKRPEGTEQVFRAKLAHDIEHTFLRTGDLGFIHDGHLFITGRLKELIIIRGRNHYPQDIERTARESCPEIPFGTGAAVSVPAGTEEHLVLVQELKRRQKADLQEIFSRIRAAILEEHEIQIHEIVLVHAGSVPKTSSGKIQRGLCRKQFLTGTLQVIGRWQVEAAREKETPETGAAPGPHAENIQAWLRSRIALRIGIDAGEIDVHRPLLHLGIDSLNAVALAHDIQNKLGLAWQATTFLEDVTLADLAGRAARQLESCEKRKEIQAPAAGTKIEYPLSSGQQGLWFLHQLSPESAAYNVVQAIRIRSSVDVPALRRALQALVDRHGCLRTTFASRDGKPIQRLHEGLEVSFHCENVQHWNDTELHERLSAEAGAPFSLAQGPLFRIHLFSRSTEEHVLLLAAHHIIVDLWSFGQMMTELGALYEAEESGKAADPLSTTSDYSRFVDWQKEMLAGEEGQELWSYWSRQLSGELPVLELPTDRPRPSVQTYRGSSCPFRLSAELTARLRSLSQDCGATLYMTLAAAFQVLLHRYTGEEDIVVGSPMAGRTRADFASTVGYFVNPVVLRVTVSPSSTFRDFLNQCVRKNILEALKHQDYPFSLLTERLQPVRDPRRSPLFQIMFAMQKAHMLHEEGLSLFALGESAARMNLGGLEMESLALDQRIAQFDLSLIMAEAGGGLAATFEYNTDLFDSATIRRMAQHFENLLQAIATDPNQDISSLRLFADAEAKEELIHAVPAEPASLVVDITVQALFERQAARTPDAPAIIFEGQQLNYRELNGRANQLAHHLAASGVLPGAPVAVCLERSPEMIVCLLAVFKAGAVYVPIDPEYPKQRLDFMLDDARVEVLITRSHLPDSAPRTGVKMLCLDLEETAICRQSTLALRNRGDSQSLAYIIYTSGSTGNPKGVLVSHRALSNHMQWLAGKFPLHQNDRVLHKYSPSFDASLAEIFYPLITGAALVIARAGGQYDLGYLIELMRERRVTAIDVVPTMLKVLIEDSAITRCQDLRQIVSGGEALSVELKEQVYERLGNVELVNMYGPTEAAITASFHRCVRGHNESHVAIGIPVANAAIHLLDRSFRPVPPGVVGEIYIGGKGLAWGYLNYPQLTAEKFVPDPFSGEAGSRLYKTGDLGRCRQDGAIACVGRADTQIKIRGFRIELGEIEAELKKHSYVKNAVAMVRVRAGGDKYIAAYAESGGARNITSAQLRAYLQERLPEHILPAAIVVMKRFPLLASGKTDIRALPEPESELPAPELAQPRGHVEQELVRIWQELLDRRGIGIHSNFFELGGDSILGIQVVARARDVGVELTPKQIFQFQTIAGLAQIVGTTLAGPEVDVPAEGPVPLTPIQRWFFEQDLQAPEHYSQTLMLEAREPLDAEVLGAAIQHLLTRHHVLRLRFDRTPQGWRQTCAGPDVSAVFRYIPVNHLPAEQQATQIEAMAREIRASLNLTTGPIIRAACFDLGAGSPQRLLITVHHLAIDGVSWRILLDDLRQVYEQLKRGKAIAFPRKILSFKRWSELLSAHAQSEEVRQESGWWTAKLSVPVDRLPVDFHGENTEESSRTLFASLPPEETCRLLQEVPRAYHTEINDALLAALAQTLARWSKAERVLIDLEGHGREEIVEGADVSGTVGWFTTLYPVLLELGSTSGPGQVLKSVKEQLRAIPRKGIGYGLLRYLCADESISAQLKKIPNAQVSFNYLGQLQQISSPGGLFELDGGLMGPMKISIGKRSHLLEIDGYIKDGSLQFQWTYSSHVHGRDAIQQVATNFINELRALVQHCAARKTSEYSSSDFPLVHITGSQLAAIQGVQGPIEDIYPLSPMQQGMLFHSLYEPRKGTYLTQLVCEFSGDLNQDAFRTAWQRVVDSHSALRTGFEWEIVTEEPVQVVREKAELKWHRDDWSGFEPEQQGTFLDTYLTDDRKREMDLREPPLMRFGLVKTGESRHLFLWSCHHLLMDGWSLPVVLSDVFGAYESLCHNQSLHIKTERLYRDYIAWLKQQNLGRAKDFWRRLLHGFAAPVPLQSLLRADAGAVNSEDFREYEVRLPESETEQLRGFARRHHLTLSTIAYGVWAVLLSRMTEKNDVVFGVVVSGRQMRLAGASAMVGVLINTLPMRARIAPGDVLSEWLKRLQEQQSEAAQFEHSPLSSIQSWSGVPRGVPLFDNIVVFENYPVGSWSSLSTNLRITDIRSFERSNYPITLWIMPEQQLCLRIGYDAHLLDESKAMCLLNDYRRLLRAVGARPQQTIREMLERTPSSSGAEADLPAVASPGKSAAAKLALNTTAPGPMARSTQSAALPLNGIGTMSAAELRLATGRRGKEEQDS